jgi:GT2 family glycosyltransferase
VLSIVVPTRPSRGRPSRTLRCLAEQDIGFEAIEVVVVVDGGIPDDLGSLRRQPMPFRMTAIEQQRRGQAAARNRGAAASGGEWLLFLDDDMDLDPAFLRQMAGHFRDDVDVVLPELRLDDHIPDTLPVRIARRREAEAREARRLGAPLVFEDLVFAATAVRRTLFERVGGFDDSFTADGGYGNEDIDLGYRLLRAGARVHRASEAIVYTDFPYALPTLLSRAQRVGRNDVRLARKHPDLAAPLFGRKLEYSRTHRFVGTAVLRAPVLARAGRLLRSPLSRFLDATDREGPLRTRLWFALRSIWYWRGVAEAGGRAVALEGRDALRREVERTAVHDPAGSRRQAHHRGR